MLQWRSPSKAGAFPCPSKRGRSTGVSEIHALPQPGTKSHDFPTLLGIHQHNTFLMMLQVHQGLLIPRRLIYLAPQGLLKGKAALPKGLGKEHLLSCQCDITLSFLCAVLFKPFRPATPLPSTRQKTLECQSETQDANCQMKAETGTHCTHYLVFKSKKKKKKESEHQVARQQRAQRRCFTRLDTTGNLC